MEVGGEPIRVQSIAQAGLTQVPLQYVQPPQHRPIHSSSSPPITIPVIDLFGSDPAQRDLVRAAIGRACNDWGAFHVIGHGISTDLLRRVKRVGLTFFNDCPVADKVRYACDPTSSATEGYGSRMLERDDTIITNGKYKSAQHRAITNAHRARLSVATFHDPAKAVKISPASQLLSKSSPPRFRGVVYGDYVSSWYTKGPEGKRNIDALLLES
ncbi:hypothetical protein G4B88_020624 [Cannabis sativa]|uniref:Non-haem dioxygenase N-terminal domain-containing protein n=1 Tax=Cannabis sativa TaxID=3483 RepID=A0A7J6EN30_CANSA|nr:hypothetical protein G4B88_020624 [Cannabis sativa]